MWKMDQPELFAYYDSYKLKKKKEKKNNTEDMTSISSVSGTNKKYMAFTPLQLTTEA